MSNYTARARNLHAHTFPYLHGKAEHKAQKADAFHALTSCLSLGVEEQRGIVGASGRALFLVAVLQALRYAQRGQAPPRRPAGGGRSTSSKS